MTKMKIDYFDKTLGVGMATTEEEGLKVNIHIMYAVPQSNWNKSFKKNEIIYGVILSEDDGSLYAIKIINEYFYLNGGSRS